MKRQVYHYERNLVKGDLIELYAKGIANLGPLNWLIEKSFSMHTKLPSGKGGNSGFTMCGFSRPLFAYLARQIMNTDGSVIRAEMERGHPFYIMPSRKITLEQLLPSNDLKVTLRGSSRGVRSLKKIVDEIFLENPENYIIGKVIADVLTEEPRLKRLEN